MATTTGPGRSRRTAHNKGELGFNLIELLIAICIIAILVAIVVVTLYGQDQKADHAVAIGNLMTGAKVVDSVWYAELANQSQCPLSGGAYRDYNPPAEMKSTAAYQTNGWVPVDAHYMSLKEPMINWVDLSVGGTSGPVASADVGSYLLADSYGFRINGVWKGGNQVASAVVSPSDWSLLPRKIGIVADKYYWDGAWQDNNTQYLTLVTLEKIAQIAHFYTLNVGVTIAGGTFEWKGGAGNPGESFGDELASEKPTTPPGGDTSSNPPADTQPTTPPADTQPTGPGTQPTQPVPPGVNMASSVKIEPDTLNLNANGQFTVFLTLSQGYAPDALVADTLRCYGASGRAVKYASGYEITIKFSRADLIGVPVGDHVLILVTGVFQDGSAFQGWDWIRTMQ